ncbi:MAG: hypothetical protein KDD65_13915 [Bacteroidetes bacterium]|nr:hypothetical protein [Bacteroidota bacterium]
MERIRRIHLAAIALLSVVVFAGCDAGGPVGPRGDDGRDGRDGIVNVHSVNFTFSLDNAIINGTVASAQFDVPSITPSVTDDGAVLMFFRDQGTWTAMPFTYGVESADPDLDAVDYTVAINFGYDDGFVEPFYESSIDIDLLPADAVPDREMKAVVIEAFLAGKNSIDYSNWEEVKRAYGLED